MSRVSRFAGLSESAAKLSSCSQTLGAVLVRGNSVLSTASNKSRNIPGNAPEGALSTHAEVAAMSQVRETKGSRIYVTRLNRKGHITMARPCRDCRTAIYRAGVSHVVWSDWNGEYQTEKVSAEWIESGVY